MKALLITFLFVFSACASAMDKDRKVQVVVANLKFKVINSASDLKSVHPIYKMAVPYMGSKGEKKVNVEAIKLYARSLDHQDFVEHIETLWPVIEKERKYFEDLVKEVVKDKKKQEKFLEHIKEYAAFIKRGNG